MTMAFVSCVLLLATSLPSVTGVTVASRAGLRARVQAKMGMHTQMQMQAKLNLKNVTGNPIRKIVNLLTKMLETNNQECEEHKRLCKIKDCACYKKLQEQQKMVDFYGAQMPELEQEYKMLYAEVHMLKLDLKKWDMELGPLKEQYRTMLRIHEKEFAQELKILRGYKADLESITAAINALNKGLNRSAEEEDKIDALPKANDNIYYGFLQSDNANVLRRLVKDQKSKVPDEDRDILESFLDQGNSEAAYQESPSTDIVIGILKQMKDSMGEEYRQMYQAYYHHTEEYQKLKVLLEGQIAALKKQILEGTLRLGEAMTRLAELDAQIRAILEGGYLREKQLLEEMKKACDKEQEECKKNQVLCAEEAHALSQAIELLNTDQALDLFKKTLPGPASLLQVQVTSKELLNQAHKALIGARQKGKSDYRMDAIALAMKSMKIDFTQVIKMIEELIPLLEQESRDDSKKKEHCINSLGEARFKHRFLEHRMGPLKAMLEEVEEELYRLKIDIDFMYTSIERLNKAVEEAGKLRKQENALYLKNLAMDNGALDLLRVAKKRLTTFYGTYLQLDQPVTQDASPVFKLIDEIMHDLEFKINGRKLAEEDAQADYEKFIADAKEAKLEKLTMSMVLRQNQDELEDKLQGIKDDNRHLLAEEVIILEVIKDLHKTCDWLIKNYEERHWARNSEILSLKHAKLILEGDMKAGNTTSAEDSE